MSVLAAVAAMTSHCYIATIVFSFSALSVLVGQQEGHLDSKNMGVGLLMVMT